MPSVAKEHPLLAHYQRLKLFSFKLQPNYDDEILGVWSIGKIVRKLPCGSP
jgi:hypothetical protein